MPRIGDQAPDFTAMTTKGQIKFSEFAKGKWVVLFSHPADFTPVCTTEMSGFTKRQKEFDELNTPNSWALALTASIPIWDGFPM